MNDLNPSNHSAEPTLRGAAWSVIIALLASVPFLNKAFHIDDVLYLAVAEQILETPFDPYGMTRGKTILWDAIDGKPDTLFQIDFNPPLWKYILAGGIAVMGREEWKLHLLSSIAVVAGSLGIYLASCCFTRRPTWCVAMIILSPFFLPGINLMLEAPLLAFLSWGIYFQWRSWDRESVMDALLAGLLVGLAILTKYTAVLFVPFFLLGSLMKRRPLSLLALLPPILLLGLWCLHNQWMYGRLHVSSHGIVFRPDLWMGRFYSVLRIIGSVSIFFPIACWALMRRGWMYLLLLGVLASISLGIAWSDWNQALDWYLQRKRTMPPGLAPFFMLFTSLGAFTLLTFSTDRLLSTRQFSLSADEHQWELWIVVLVLFNIVSVPFNAVRHLLILFMALTWLSARLADRLQLRTLPTVVVLLSTSLSYLLAAGDYEYANGYRQFAQTEIRGAKHQVGKIWITGTWGYKYYAEREGAVSYYPGILNTVEGRPIPGDIIYHSQLLNWAPIMMTVEGAQPSSVSFLPARLPCRLVMPGINYYGVGTELLPWGAITHFASDGFDVPPLDAIVTYEIRSP
jgi:4-amino-4-deoxy-L-arabinose transferase-like glycosyltransferase